MDAWRAIKMEKESSKTRVFSVELKSKSNSKNMMVTNGGSTDLTEGVLGELVRAYFAEGMFWEALLTSGILIVDRRENEIAKPKLKDEAEAK